MKNSKNLALCFILVVLTTILFSACGVISVRGKTFVFEKVEIDWGRASKEDKELIFEEFLVSNETELLNVLKTRNGRNSRITTFGTNGKYTTVNVESEILDEGYYKQDDEVITLSETQDGFLNYGNYTLKVVTRGYYAIDKINDELGIYARYLYVVSD